MKTSKVQKDIGGNTMYMKRLAIANKGCDQLTSNNIYFSNWWSSFVKTAGEMAAEGVVYCWPEKTNNNGFSLAKLEKC